MSHKQNVGILLVFSVIGIVIGLIFIQPENYGICPPDKLFGCIEPLGNNVGQPLFLGSISLSVVFLVLFFLPKPYLKAWLKYVTWFIPVAVLWIVTASDGCGGFLTLCFDKELATWWSSGIYVVLSLVVFIATYLKRRREIAQV